jgi:hypothetical protein
MLVRPHDGGVEDQVFEVRVDAQRGEKTLPNAFLSPPAETPEDAVPFAELFGQVAPGCAGTNQPQHSVDEQTIVFAVAASVTGFAWNKRLDVLPLPVRQFSPNQDPPPQSRS